MSVWSSYEDKGTFHQDVFGYRLNLFSVTNGNILLIVYFLQSRILILKDFAECKFKQKLNQ
jgi:hypothetical protein